MAIEEKKQLTLENLERYHTKAKSYFGTVKTVQGVAPSASGDVTVPVVTTAKEGLMSKEDKAKLDGLATVATSGAYADLSGVPTKVSEFENDAAYVTKDTDITGNAATATKATQDGNGKVIADTYAPLADAALTGVPTAPTAASGTSTTQIATTEFVAKAMADVEAGVSTSIEWQYIKNKPETFAPSAHEHAATEVTGLATVATSGAYADLSGVPTKVSEFENDAAYVTKDTDITGTAAKAEALTSSAGSEVIPVHFVDGKPVACTFKLEKSVPADAVFTDTDTKVVNTLDASTKAYITGTTSATTNTGGQVFNTGVYLDAAEGVLVATTLKGALVGNADSATKATQDGAGNVIVDTYAPLVDAALTGVPTAPTAALGTNTTQIATTAYVQAEVAQIVGNAPETLNALNELAAALGNDENFATTISNQIGTKLSAADGIAFGAKKLATDSGDVAAGAANKGVYFVNGLPVACTYEVNVDVPADAKFTDTTYVAATDAADGLMSAADKAKLDSIVAVSDEEIDALFA